VICASVEEFVAALPPNRAIAGLDLIEVIRREKFTLDAGRLLALLEARGAFGIVLGLPLNMDGTVGPRVQATQAFARKTDQAADLLLGRASVDGCGRKGAAGGGYVAKASERGHRPGGCRIYPARCAGPDGTSWQ